MQIIRRGWREGQFEFAGDHFQIPPSPVHPNCVQKPHVPILVGGSATAAIQRARDQFVDVTNLEFEVIDVLQANLPARSFDALIDRGCLHTLKTPETRLAYAKTVASWAAPGAAFLLIFHLSRGPIEQLTSQIQELFDAHFELVDVRSCSMDGPYADKPIPGAVFRLIRHDGAASGSSTDPTGA